ncbi:MAG: NTP transferase domain-containing protein [Chloroflexi bacterium]|nr:NTP transferase domain-containing protein [Chloroflexota bacterium]
MKAVIMAGGQGTRLRPLTVNRPKPLMPLVNKPVIGHIVDWLKRHRLHHMILTLQHKAEWFQNYLPGGANIGVRFDYLIEDVPLGTAGGVANALRAGLVDETETILVVSGDALTDIDIAALLEFHRSRAADVTVALHRVSDPLEYGMVITEADGRITRFIEKPGWGDVVSDLVNTGVYALEASVLKRIPPHTAFDFSHDLFPQLMAEGRRVFGCDIGGYWCDIGSPATYLQANGDVLYNRVQHEPLGKPIGGDIWVGENVEIAPDARLYGPIYLGHNVQIKGGVVIQGPTVIRDDTVIDNRAQISRSVIWRGCYVGEDTQLNGALICRQCVFKRRVFVQEGAMIGDRCIIGEGAVISPNVKLWPGKEIDAGAIIRESIVWGSHGRRVLFTRFGVTGVVNVDLTPEFAAKLGVAFGASLPKGSYVTINRDWHPTSRMIKRAIISGLPAAGVNVWDLRAEPIPVARYLTRTTEAKAGVHVRISPFDRRVVDIRFMDEDGMNLGRAKEREIERLFFREDFRRAQLDDIGAISYFPEERKTYIRAFMQALDRDQLRDAGFHIAVDYAHATTVNVLEPILTELGVDALALNTTINPQKLSVLPEEWERGMTLLTKVVAAMELDLGARLDVSGSQVFLVDDLGRRVSDSLAAAALAELAWRNWPEATVAVSVELPSVFERLAARRSGRVIRTKVDLHALMSMAAREDVTLAVDGKGHFILPALHPVPDGMFALASLLQCLAHHHVRLSDVLADIPPFYWQCRTVSCTLDAKGRVMRLVNEWADGRPVDATDGVKVFFDDESWMHVRPDPDRPLLHLCVEAPTRRQAQALLEEKAAWLESLKH